MPSPIPSAPGTMEIIVVRVVIRIGRSLVLALSISASSRAISVLSRFTPSTYRIPLFTTMPASIRTPIREIILNEDPDRNRSPKDPIRLNGMLSITISEYRGDSNCIAITKNTRKIAAARASPRERNDSFIISSIVLTDISTESGKSSSSASRSISA